MGENLDINKKEIETELLKKVKMARLRMDKELKEEITKLRKESQEQDRKKKEDYEKFVAETEKNLEEEKKNEEEEVERRVKDRLEKHIVKMVDENLDINKKEMETDHRDTYPMACLMIAQ